MGGGQGLSETRKELHHGDEREAADHSREYTPKACNLIRPGHKLSERAAATNVSVAAATASLQCSNGF